MWEVPPLAPGDFKVFFYQVSLDAATPVGTIVTGGPGCGGTASAIRKCCDSTGCNVDCMRSNGGNCGNARSGTREPLDPNEKGAIAQRFIQPDQTLVYPIHFENIGNIEARDVFVTDVLDPNLDASTVQILTPGGTFNAATRTVRWALLGINLPPGESDNVLLAVKPLPGLPSGTEIRNRAAMQFEVFETITTNEVVNIIDSTPPTCVMAPLPNIAATPGFPLAWSGTDAIGEIASYTILVAVNGGGFTPLLNNTTETSTMFDGVPGTYGFICVATDTAGNIEVQSLIAEATTTIVANQPPVAQCQNVTEPANLSCQASASVNNGSFDPDGGLLTLTQSPAGPYSLASTPVSLRVTDDKGASASCSATVTVVDQTPPSMTCPAPQTLECTGPKGAVLSFSATAWDNCSSGLTPSCTWPSGSTFPLGNNSSNTCTAIDGAGNQSTCSFPVNVVDTTPPAITSVVASPQVLWPPNHQMVPVQVTLFASDRCDAAPACRVVSVSSNEPVEGLGDGHTSPDWEVTGNLAVKLRAERSGKGSGRVYTITAMCTDASGNSSTQTTTVTVPHDQGKK